MEPRETSEMRKMRRDWMRDEAMRGFERRTALSMGACGALMGLAVDHLIGTMPQPRANQIYCGLIVLVVLVNTFVLIQQHRALRRHRVFMQEDRADVIASHRKFVEELFPNNPESVDHMMSEYEKAVPKL